MRKKEPISTFKLYERAVQSPRWQVDYLPQFHRWLTQKPLVAMREDFCGTGRISCEWAKKSKKNRAVGLDLDQKTLQYAFSVNRAALTREQQTRVKLLRQNVLQPSRDKFDMVGAHNFSFFTFYDRKTLIRYFKSVYLSLHTRGTFFLEMAGGEGFREPVQEPHSFSMPGYGKFESVWEQHRFDPVTHLADYSIHFKYPDGKWRRNVFEYHWRVWQIPEVREALAEAGFKKSVILWDPEGDSQEFVPLKDGEAAENRWNWLAYVVGVKG